MDLSTFFKKTLDAETVQDEKYEQRRQIENSLQEDLKFNGAASQPVKKLLHTIANSYSEVEVRFGICRMYGDFENAFVTPDGLVKKLDIGLSLKIKAQSFWPKSLGESLVGALTTQFNNMEGPYVTSDLINSIKKAMAEVYFRLRDPPQAPVEANKTEDLVGQTDDAEITDGDATRSQTPKTLVRLKISPTKARFITSTSRDQTSSAASHDLQHTASPQNPNSPTLQSSSSEKKGHGNPAHGAQVPWFPDELDFCKTKITEANGNITWSQLAAVCNQEFADKPVTLASGVQVQRGTRTEQSMRQHVELKECRWRAKAGAGVILAQGLSVVREDVVGEEVEGEERVEE
ncbi:hypothetical protein KC318_g296 [Hortaea werneckii]|nr:hypothetical protein KC334_g290 [Hortaea werneckii]KAI7026184.1 hypothetical protein KC355_g732 [Hortaea werneckii]KAI7204582.1 hypothetical protein KC324_g696 [Hortaea werneckii]KAI7593785.1 hypothetical protein KC316_g1508 [Hortaea werneckii]KAI7676391.1 hypothetical protein KC318_g296 [Hortaea werneckii]